MAELKFSCPQCGQHISCDQAWSGHQIQCPGCQAGISVPHLQAPSARVESIAKPPPVAAPGRPRLAAGATQVARPSPIAPVGQKRAQPRPPKTMNPAVRYAGIAVVLLLLGGAALKFLPGLLDQVQDIGASKSSGTASSPGVGTGPLGEVNGAMDVSDALDGGSSRSRPVSARQPPPAQAGRVSATNGIPNKKH